MQATGEAAAAKQQLYYYTTWHQVFDILVNCCKNTKKKTLAGDYILPVCAINNCRNFIQVVRSRLNLQNSLVVHCCCCCILTVKYRVSLNKTQQENKSREKKKKKRADFSIFIFSTCRYASIIIAP